VKQSMNPGAMKTNDMKNRVADGLFVRPAADTVAPVEPEDLSRFEGEGGHEAPAPGQVDVPLENAVWRRPRWTAKQTNQMNMTNETIRPLIKKENEQI